MHFTHLLAAATALASALAYGQAGSSCPGCVDISAPAGAFDPALIVFTDSFPVFGAIGTASAVVSVTEHDGACANADYPITNDPGTLRVCEQAAPCNPRVTITLTLDSSFHLPTYFNVQASGNVCGTEHSQGAWSAQGSTVLVPFNEATVVQCDNWGCDCDISYWVRMQRNAWMTEEPIDVDDGTLVWDDVLMCLYCPKTFDYIPAETGGGGSGGGE